MNPAHLVGRYVIYTFPHDLACLAYPLIAKILRYLFTKIPTASTTLSIMYLSHSFVRMKGLFFGDKSNDYIKILKAKSRLKNNNFSHKTHFSKVDLLQVMIYFSDNLGDFHSWFYLSFLYFYTEWFLKINEHFEPFSIYSNSMYWTSVYLTVCERMGIQYWIQKTTNILPCGAHIKGGEADSNNKGKNI